MKQVICCFECYCDNCCNRIYEGDDLWLCGGNCKACSKECASELD